jgi:hypothetical protein
VRGDGEVALDQVRGKFVVKPAQAGGAFLVFVDVIEFVSDFRAEKGEAVLRRRKPVVINENAPQFLQTDL